jgi:hypothetical protein
VKRIRKRLTYANVMSSLAVFLVLGGGAAFAAKKIGTNELKGASVTTAKIKRNAVTTSKIRKGSISASRLASAAVTNGKLADGSVTAQKLVPGFVAPTAEKPARSVNVSASGTVLPGSLGIAQANLSHLSTGFYCFSGLNPAPVGGVATVDYSESGENVLIQFDTGQGPVCPVGTQAFVNPRVISLKNGKIETTAVDAGFFLTLY